MDTKALEERLKKLEEQLKKQTTDKTGDEDIYIPPFDKKETLEERVQNIEDIMLLIQLEQEKLREAVVSKTGTQGSAIAGAEDIGVNVDNIKNESYVTRRLAEIEGKVDRMTEIRMATTSEKRLEKLDNLFINEISRLDRRIIALEEKVFHHSSSEKSIIEELHSILNQEDIEKKIDDDEDKKEDEDNEHLDYKINKKRII